MPIDREQWFYADLERGLQALRNKQDEIDSYWDYYHNRQPKVWLNEKLRETFESLVDSFNLNYCKLAINTPLNRLQVLGWEEETVKSAWQELRLDREQPRIYKHALIAGESYLIVWYDEQGRLEAGFNDARNVHLFTDGSDPRRKHYAIQRWIEDLGGSARWRVNLWYPDQLLRLRGPVEQVNPDAMSLRTYLTPQALDFDPVDPGGTHDFGEVPVFRFSGDVFDPTSELEDLTPIQDKINKLSSNKMVAGEFGAFAQRVYLTTQELPPKELLAMPGEALRLDPGDADEHKTDIKEFPATPLANYDGALDAEVDRFFTIAHLPRHLLIQPGADSSGDAIRADESPFTEKVATLAKNFGYVWTDVMFLITGQWDKPIWKDAQAHNEEANARIYKMLVEAQVPPFYAAQMALKLTEQQAQEFGLPKEVVQTNGAANLSDRSPSSPRSQTTEDNKS